MARQASDSGRARSVASAAAGAGGRDRVTPGTDQTTQPADRIVTGGEEHRGEQDQAAEDHHTGRPRRELPMGYRRLEHPTDAKHARYSVGYYDRQPSGSRDQPRHR